MSKGNTLLDVALETLNSSLKESLLVLVQRVERVKRLLGTVGAKLDGNGEELESTDGGLDGLTAWDGKVDKGWLNDVLLASSSAENLLSEAETSVGHGEGGRASTILGLDDLITTELDAVDERGELVGGDGDGWLGLAEEGDDGLAGVATDDGDGGLLGVLGAGDLGNEGLGTDDVEGGDTEEALGVEDTLGLEDLGGDGDGGVDGVRDDENEGLGGDIGDDLNEALDDTGVDVEEVITGHSWLACEGVSMILELHCSIILTGNASGDDNDVCVLEGKLRAVILWQVASDLL